MNQIFKFIVEDAKKLLTAIEDTKSLSSLNSLNLSDAKFWKIAVNKHTNELKKQMKAKKKLEQQ